MEDSGGKSLWEVFCLFKAQNRFLPFDNFLKVTNLGCWLVFAVCTVTGIGEWTLNHRMFLNIDVMLCMKLPEFFLFIGLIVTTVDFLSNIDCCSSSLLEHLRVWADIELVNLSKFVVLFFLYLIGRHFWLESLKLLLLDIVWNKRNLLSPPQSF